MKKILFAIIFPAMLLMTACSGPSEIVTDCAKVRLTVYNPSIIRVEKGVDGESFSNDPGLTVVMDPQKAKFKTKKTDTAFILTTEALEVSVNLSDATISVRRKGTPIIAENSGYQPGFQRFALDNNEAIYGLGQHRDLPLNLRGKEIKLLNVNMEISIPLVHSSKGYAIFWTNLSSTLFSDSAEGMSFKSEVGEGVDYFVISGDSADDVIAGIRALSGQVPMFPSPSPKSAISRRKRLWEYCENIASCKYQSTASCRTGSIGEKTIINGMPLNSTIRAFQPRKRCSMRYIR